MEFKDKITKNLQDLASKPLTDEERAVMSVLVLTFKMDRYKVSQRDIARSVRWLGCHPTHEAMIARNKWETTTRQVRQIINDLRLKYQVPILSDRHGYWIARRESEAREYLSRIELEVKSLVKANFERYKAMKEALDISSEYMERLL